LGAAVVAALGAGTLAVARDNERRFDETLTGFEEVSPVSTAANGQFSARINKDETEIEWQLTFSSPESDATMAHIHWEHATNNGPIVIWLCSNLTTPTPPPGTQACPAQGGTISGTITAADVTAAAADRGLEAGNLAEFINMLRQGGTYVNVHTVARGGGEIRAQLGDDHRHGDD